MERLQQALDKARRERASAAARDNAIGPVRSAAGWRADGAEPFLDATQLADLPLDLARLRRNRIVAHLGEGERAWAGQWRAAEAYRILRTRALHTMQAAERRVISVASASQGEGKTVTAINLAIAVSRQPGTSVLLIDGDLRRPAIAGAFGIAPTLGLSDYLAGREPVEAVTLQLGLEHLLVIPQPRPAQRSSELLANGRLAALLDRLRRHHPNWYVIIDGPPLLAVDDGLVLLRLVDGCLLVVREGSTRKRELRRAAELIGEAKYLGSVLNASVSLNDNGYDYQYYGYGTGAA